MKYLLTLTFTLVCLISFSQTNKDKKEGLKKISPDREPTHFHFGNFNIPDVDMDLADVDFNFDFDVDFDEQFHLSMEQLDINMELVELGIEQLDINMEEFDMNMEQMELDLEICTEQMIEIMKEKKIKIHKIKED